MEPLTDSSENKSEDFEIDIKYEAVIGLKTDAVSGVFSNVNSDGQINLVFFTQRRKYPLRTTITISADEVSEGADEFENGGGFVRELSHSILLNKSVARFLISSLQKSLDKLSNSSNESTEGEGTENSLAEKKEENSFNQENN